MNLFLAYVNKILLYSFNGKIIIKGKTKDGLQIYKEYHIHQGKFNKMTKELVG